jgi:hypothetical protein
MTMNRQTQVQDLEYLSFGSTFKHQKDTKSSSSTSMHNCAPFPWKIHEMLDAAEKQGFTSIVSWLPGNNAFKVHNSTVFVEHAMPQYFKQTKYKSFQRQLNIWGFMRVLEGPDKGGYTHSCFVRDNSSLCRNMKRQKIKGTGTPRSRPRPTSSTKTTSARPVTPMTPTKAAMSVRCESLVSDHSMGPLTPEVTPTESRNDDCVSWFEGRKFYFVSADYDPKEKTTKYYESIPFRLPCIKY